MDIDVLVVGSGGAGMLAAATAAAAGQRTVLLSKCQVARSGATATITGDCSVDGKTCVDLLGLKADPNDDEQAFFEDTIKGGRFLNDQRLVEDMSKRLEGKIAVITGGAQGIGRVTAILFAGEGAKLVLLDKDATKVKAVADEINAGGGSASAVACDISKQPEVVAAINDANAKHGDDQCPQGRHRRRRQGAPGPRHRDPGEWVRPAEHAKGR